MHGETVKKKKKRKRKPFFALRTVQTVWTERGIFKW